MQKISVEQYSVAINTCYYYLRQKLWHTMIRYCQKQYQNINDPVFQFWKAFGLTQVGSYNEAINELNQIKNKKEIQYATVCALIDYNQLTQNVDREALQELKQMELEGRRMAGDKSLIISILYFLFSQQEQKSKEILLELAPTANSSANILLVQGWFYFHTQQIPSAFDSFTTALNSNKNIKSLEAMIGLMYCFKEDKKYNEMINQVNEIQVLYEDYQVGKLEKAYASMLNGDWDSYYEIVHQSLEQENDNIIALKYISFYYLARIGNMEQACLYLDQLFNTIANLEVKNTDLFYQLSQLYARLSGKNKLVLDYTIKACTYAKKLSPLNSDYLAELGYQFLMIQNYEKAYKSFEESLQFDEQRQDATNGMIQCRIYQGIIDDAEAQIEFNKEINKHLEQTADGAYLEASLLERKQDQDVKQKFSLIDKALNLHIKQSQNKVADFDWYITLNPVFLLQLAETYLSDIDIKSMLEGKQRDNKFIDKGIKLLDKVIRQIPGLVGSYILMAKAKMALGFQQEGLGFINKALELDSNNEDSYILHALIANKNNSFNQAYTSLEQAISNNFQIRENPLFMLIKAQVEYNQKEFENSLQTIQVAYELPGVKDKNMPGSTNIGKKSNSTLQLTDTDRCQIFLQLAKSLTQLKRTQESKTIMTNAISEFAGTDQEPLVLLTNADIAVNSGDIKTGLDILKNVPKGSICYKDSRIQMAEVYLNNLKDRRHFAKCYFDLAVSQDDYEGWFLLGNAMMKINEPEDAVTAFQNALNKKPNDEESIRLLGKALCKTYDYEKAIEYYQNSIKTNSKNIQILLDYAKLCIKVKKFSEAEELLKQQQFVDEYSGTSLQSYLLVVKGFKLTALLYQKKSNESGVNEQVRSALKKAIQYQQRDVIEKAKVEDSLYRKQVEKLGNLYIQMAEYFSEQEKKPNLSLNMLDEALKFSENEKIMELQIKYLFKLERIQDCEKKCKLLLKVNPQNDYGCFMLAELLVQQDESTQAISTFSKTLEENPNNYAVLAKLIDFERRQMNIETALIYLKKADQKATNKNDPGLCYCWGLYHLYNRSPKDALLQFNKAKKSSQYSEQSLVHMIDIYLNPDQDLYFSSVDNQKKQVSPENIQICETLLREMQTRASYNRYIVMESYVLMMGTFNNGLEKAIQNLSEILKSNNEYIPAMVALVIGKFIVGKATDAKNLLKIISKKNYVTEFADDFEKAWLLYADSFIAIQKYDNAEEILKKCLKYNKSCGKSEEIMGLIKEKESAYIDAAVFYERANKLTNGKSASITFRLAFNYLKAKRYVDCVNICKKILEIYPNYYTLEKEILLKARACLR